MHIKICGLTNLDDALVALDAGADLLGFNFYRPSPRYIAPEIAASIIASLRAEFESFDAVGVFVNESLDRVRAVQQQCALDLVQLHGDETLEFCRAVGARAFKALRPQTAEEAEKLVERYSPSPRPSPAGRGGRTLPSPSGRGVGGEGERPHFLLDASHPQLYGGSGATSDWTIAREIAAHHPILLAGGLNPSNVADAIRAVHPWGVDVASGVERAPGLKDAQKLRHFIREARTHD